MNCRQHTVAAKKEAHHRRDLMSTSIILTLIIMCTAPVQVHNMHVCVGCLGDKGVQCVGVLW